MRHLNPFAIALVASCAAFNAHAVENAGDPCSLLDWQDFQSIGAVQDTALIDLGWREEQTPKQIPDSKLFSSICAVEIKSGAESSTITLSVDSFMGNVTEQQVGEWLKSVGPGEAGKLGVVIVKVGSAICESGQDNLTTSQSAKVAEHYIACDQQVGIKHISLNINVPVGKKAELLNPEQINALLSKSIARMKQNAFAEPDKSI